MPTVFGYSAPMTTFGLITFWVRCVERNPVR